MRIPIYRAVVFCALLALAGIVGCKREPEVEAPPAEETVLSPMPEASPIAVEPTPIEVTPTPPPAATPPPSTPRPVEPAPRATPKASPAPAPRPAAAERTPTPAPRPAAPTPTPRPAAPPPTPEEKPTPTPAPAAPPAPETTSGQQIFIAQKCNTCHSVSSAGITAKVKSGKTFGGDLTGIGERRSRQSAENVALQKEQVEGKKHLGKFTGSPAELEALLDWLLAQR